MTTTADPGLWTRIVARLPACVLLMTCLTFTLSYLTDRSLLDQSGTLLALLLPLLWLMIQPTVSISDGAIERWFILALLLLVWMAGVQYARADALPAGWIRFAERGAALATCLIVVVRRVPTRELISLFGTAAACVSVTSLVMDGGYGQLHPLSVVNFGLGHINVLMDLAGPSLLAWAALIAGDAWNRRAVRLRDLVVMLCGVAALVIIAVATLRRGVFVAAGLAALWPLAGIVWRRQRWLAVVLGVVLVALGALVAVHLLSEDPPSMRNERMNVYRAAIAGVIAGFPFGFGHFGMIHTMLLPAEACRHLSACGGWLQHAHNEFLDIALDGGLVALAIALALTALVAVRLSRIRDPGVRLALQMMGIALLVHLMTDHVFGLATAEVWLGAVVGMMLSAPVMGPAIPALRLLPRVRILAWPFTLLACWGALHHFYPAFMHAQAEPEIRMRCLKQALEPLTVDTQVGELLGGEHGFVDEPSSQAIFALATRTIGWTGRSTVRYAISEAIKYDHAQDAVTGLCRMLAIVPFYRQGYDLLAFIIHRHPECASSVPGDVRRRMSSVGGDAELPRPDLSAVPRTIDAAIDAYAGIIWSITNHRPWSLIAEALQRLCARYGDIPGIAQLTLEAVRAAPAGTFPWLTTALPVLDAGLRVGFDETAFCAGATTTEQARALLPVIAHRYPEVVRDVRLGTVSTLDGDPDLRNQLVRLIALAGMRGAATGAP
jgi:hypothetical protein